MSILKITGKNIGKSSSLERKSLEDDAASFLDRNDVVVFCKIFSDMVVDSLCLLRRKELHAVEDLSCRGCIMDLLMKREYSFMKNIVLIGRKGGGDMLRTDVPSEGQQYDDPVERNT